MAHKHSVYNTDEHFLIDGVTRAITQQSGKTRLMQYDHNSERYEFEMPRYIDSHDMSLCNRVQIHFINVGSGGSSSSDVYKVTDLIASPADDKVIIFSWLVSQNATMYAGSLNFLIQFACVQDDGTVDYLWHTDICKGISVSSGFNNSENIIEQYSDILMQWEQQLFGAGDSVKQQIGAKSQEELAAIEAKGEAVLLSIPEEYSETAAKADETIRTKADAIVQTVDGTAIIVSDSSNDFLRGLRIFGKSTQDGTPTSDTPVEIVNVDNPILSIFGKNLLDLNSCTFGRCTNNNGIVTSNFEEYYYASISTTELNEILLNSLGKTFTFSVDKGITDSYMSIVINGVRSDGTTFQEVSSNVGANSVAITLAEDFETIYMLGLRWNRQNKVHTDTESQITNIQFELGDIATEFEAFKNVQTIPVTRILPGIRVESNGNYTDSNGQQWVCDEVDFEKGVYIQRILRKIIDGSVSFTAYNPAQWVTNAVGYYRKTGAELNKGGYAVMSDSLPKTGLGNLMDSRGIICHPTLDGFIYISLPFELLGITATTDANVGLAAMTA